MPLIAINTQMLSDLVFHELDPSVGYARRVVNVTATGGTVIPLGRVVFRTIASGAVDQAAPYALLTTPGTQLVATNEFAVVFGDKFSYNPAVVADADGTTACVSYVRDEVFLKDDLLLSANSITRGSADHLALKALLEKQGIMVETTLGA